MPMPLLFEALIRDRLYGMIFAALIFIHITSYIIAFLNNNILNIFLFVVFVSILGDIAEDKEAIESYNFKYYNNFNYICKVCSLVQLLRFHKDLGFILSYRHKISIISQLILRQIFNY